MKYLTNFKTKEEYEAFKAGGEYLTPNVSFIETAGSVINDSYQVQGGSASTMEYINFNNVDTSVVSAIMEHSSKLKYFFSESGYLITQAVYVYARPDTVGRIDPVAAAIDFSVKYIHNFTGAIMEQSVKEMIISEGVTEEQLASLPRITEAEFYNLDVPN